MTLLPSRFLWTFFTGLQGIEKVTRRSGTGILPGAIGINVVPMGKPAPVKMTVTRALEDVNPLCTAECTDLFGDGSGRCRQVRLHPLMTG